VATRKRKSTGRRTNGNGNGRKKTLKAAWRAIPGWLKWGGAAVAGLAAVGKIKKMQGEP
jgi:hypothetical protein